MVFFNLLQGIPMKNLLLFIICLLAVACFGNDNMKTGQEEMKSFPAHDTAGFTQSRVSIQSTYNAMYAALPLDQQNRIQSAALSMENIRQKPSVDAQTFLSSQRQRAELSMTSAVSQMSVTDAVRTQIDNSRREIYQRINEKIHDLKTRRASRR
jgi:hypothetical protein